MELSYTRDMESHFDEVEQGKAEYAKVVRDAYFTLQGEMSALEGVVAPAATQSKSKALQSGYVCPQCQKSLRLIKSEFWGCTGYPGCKFTAPNVKGKPQPRAEKKTDINAVAAGARENV